MIKVEIKPVKEGGKHFYSQKTVKIFGITIYTKTLKTPKTEECDEYYGIT
jgi:hypothetical protein